MSHPAAKFLHSHYRILVASTAATLILAGSLIHLFQTRTQLTAATSLNASLLSQVASHSAQITALTTQVSELESQDPRAENKQLTDALKQIKTTYTQSLTVYENLSDLKLLSKNTKDLDTQYAQAINYLSAANYSSASAILTQLTTSISAEKAKATTLSGASGPLSGPASNTPPSSGYSRQTVNSDAGSFVVSIVSADLGSTKVIVDTASDGDCGNNCPVLPLATYVSRSGAYAGINGSYFCPASYPTCAGKTNSFDLLVMNKNKTYFNSANNVYSSNPAVIFGSGYVRFVGAASQWGRDTGIDGMLSNYPLLLSGNNVVFGGNDDPKQGSKGNRSFVANRGNTVYIGVVHSATVAETARVLKAMGLENALNLDDGGSTALWSAGYKVGPGRDLPNVILFVRK